MAETIITPTNIMKFVKGDFPGQKTTIDGVDYYLVKFETYKKIGGILAFGKYWVLTWQELLTEKRIFFTLTDALDFLECKH